MNRRKKTEDQLEAERAEAERQRKYDIDLAAAKEISAANRKSFIGFDIGTATSSRYLPVRDDE